MCYTCLPIYCEILFREVYYSHITLQSSFLKTTIVSPHSLSILCTRWALSPLLCCSTQKGKKYQQYLLVFLYLVLYTRFRLLYKYYRLYKLMILCVKKKVCWRRWHLILPKQQFLEFFFLRCPAWTERVRVLECGAVSSWCEAER